MFELAVDWTRVLGMIGDIIKGTSNTRRQFAKLRVWMGAYGEELQSNMVCNYSHADKLDLTQLVRADKPSLLARAPHELKLSYTFRGQTHTRCKTISTAIPRSLGLG